MVSWAVNLPLIRARSLRPFLFLYLAVASLCGSLRAAEPAGGASDLARPTLVFSQFSPDKPLRLVVYGDSRFTDPTVTTGTAPRIRRWLAERVGQERPQAVLLTGDTPYIGSRAADWRDFQQETASWRAQHILELPATGNHEAYSEYKPAIANYLANFPSIAGHRYYSAVLGNVEVISLDCTQPAGTSSVQSRWFAAQLDHIPSAVEFLLILYHIPWMADRQSQILVGLPGPDALSLRDILEARLPRIRARVLVFNGHIHNYERFERRGVIYVVTGGGGAEPYPVLYRGADDLYRDPGFPVYHYVTLDIGAHQLHATMWKVKDPDAKELAVEQKDEFTVQAVPAAESKRHAAR